MTEDATAHHLFDSCQAADHGKQQRCAGHEGAELRGRSGVGTLLHLVARETEH